MKVSIVVPYRPDHGWRDRLWEFSSKRWAEHFPDWPIYEGVHGADEGPFNRSIAINRAVEAALADRRMADDDVLLVIDNDTLSDPAAVRRAVEVAHTTNTFVVAHDERVMLNRSGTEQVLAGYTGSWRQRSMLEKVGDGGVWRDSVSCAVAVPVGLFRQVRGFDPLFVGWGREDTAFRIACEVASGGPILKVAGETFHLWHEPSPGVAADSPTRQRNERRHQRYVEARWDPEAVAALIAERDRTAELPAPRVLEPTDEIPRILHRTVPEQTDKTVECYWARFEAMHPGWKMMTWRDPLDPEQFPYTSDLWDLCANGAQLAGLVRLEVLYTHGGIYVDSDVEPLRSMEPLRRLWAFAGWEDAKCVPDAVLGSVPGHPAFHAMLTEARLRLEAGQDAWHTGPGVTTSVLPGRDDVVLFGPSAFYPYHYLEKARAREDFAKTTPAAFCVHRWHGSWLSSEQRTSIERRQR